MATYSELVGGTRASNTGGILRDWANRDSNVLNSGVIARCLDWSADECYRTLRVPTLELTRTLVLSASQVEHRDETNFGANLATFPVPADYIESIYISRVMDAQGNPVNTVFNHRVDNRTIIDSDADVLRNSFTRVGNEFQLFGDVEVGDTIRVHYYRRLPALDATYVINAANFNSQSSAEQFFSYPSGNIPAGTGTENQSGVYLPSTITNTSQIVYTGTNATVATDTFTSGQRFLALTAKEAAHWLRDDNERILVFGAMMEVFNFLDEPESFARYQQRFYKEIEDLNAQERRRDAMGGNVQVSYNGGGLL